MTVIDLCKFTVFTLWKILIFNMRPKDHIAHLNNKSHDSYQIIHGIKYKLSTTSKWSISCFKRSLNCSAHIPVLNIKPILFFRRWEEDLIQKIFSIYSYGIAGIAHFHFFLHWPSLEFAPFPSLEFPPKCHSKCYLYLHFLLDL